MPSELLFTCPRCYHTGFTMRGLRLHNCRGLGSDRDRGQPGADFTDRPERRRLTEEELASAVASPSPASGSGFGGRIRDLRLRSGLSVAEFADKCGCVRSYVYAIENGDATNPSRVFVKRVAAAFGVASESLMEGKNRTP